MQRLYLPVLSHFRNGNLWTGSDRRLRYRIDPHPDAGTLTAQAWEGPWSCSLSRVEDSRDFSLDEAGLEALAGWIACWSETINARPPRTLDETLQARQEVLDGQPTDKPPAQQ